jgi:hypothetical protein
MAVSQLSNSVRLNQLPLKPTLPSRRIDVGVTAMSSAPDHIGWRLVAAAVRLYRTISPKGRALLHAFFVALFLAAISIQLIVIAAR